MNAAIVVIVVLLVINGLLLWVLDRNSKRREAKCREAKLPAEQSRAHARADERQWADDVALRIWRNK